MKDKRIFKLFPLHPITERIALASQVLCVLVLAGLFLSGCTPGPVLGIPFPRWLVGGGLGLGTVAIWIFWVVRIRGRLPEERVGAERERGPGIFLALLMLIAVVVLFTGPHTSPSAPAPTPAPTLMVESTPTVAPTPSPYEGWGVIVLERLVSQEATEVVLNDPLPYFGGRFYVVPDEYGPTLKAGPSQSGEMFEVSFLGKVAIGGNRYLLFPYCKSGEYPTEVRAGNVIQAVPSWRSGNAVYYALSSITCE